MPPGWEILWTAEGERLLGDLGHALDGGAGTLELAVRLRAEGRTGDEAAVLLGQAELRRKAVTKFGERARRMRFTPAGLEQATRTEVAALHAERFRAAGCTRVADLGCGIGAESMALADAGVTPRAVELDALTAAIASHNLTLTAHPGTVEVADATTVSLDGVDGVFLDPARRTLGHRDTRRVASPDDYSPSLAFAFDVAGRHPTGIKLGPGIDRRLIPAEAEAQWVSVNGAVVELGLWFGAVARPGVRRAALILDGTGRHELVAAEDAPDAATRPLGPVIYEPDGAVIRARLIGRLAADLGAGMLSDGIAYLTSDTVEPTPFASAFRVLEEVPVNEKQLRRALAARDIGRLEIKKRGVDVDPAALRRRLKLRGASGATLIVTRAQGRHIALLAERVGQED